MFYNTTFSALHLFTYKTRKNCRKKFLQYLKNIGVAPQQIPEKDINYRMETLFPEENKFPEGFRYIPGFLDSEEEKELVAAISELELTPFIFHGYEAKRKVASFGYNYNFNDGSMPKEKPVPSVFEPVVKKVADFLSIAPQEFRQLLVTEYPAGSVINWHRDAPPFELIAGISLLTECKFRLRPYEKSRQTRSSIVSFTVHPRSLYVISGPARNRWQHSTAAVKNTRYSITLRTLREKK